VFYRFSYAAVPTYCTIADDVSTHILTAWHVLSHGYYGDT